MILRIILDGWFVIIWFAFFKLDHQIEKHPHQANHDQMAKREFFVWLIAMLTCLPVGIWGL